MKREIDEKLNRESKSAISDMTTKTIPKNRSLDTKREKRASGKLLLISDFIRYK